VRCPECFDELVPANAGAVEIDCCSTCGGIWLDFGELRRIEPAAAPEITGSVGPRAAAGTCPRCPEVSLWSHPLAPDMPSLVAECRACGGVWLAASELAAVKRYAETRRPTTPRPPSRPPPMAVRRPRRSSSFGDPALADLLSGALSLFMP
jgi:Zn-finger nucleic acid-binding protein